MSDYLSHITAKSFNQAEVLQPRLASRFEPSAAVSHLQAEAVLDWKQPLATDPLLEPEPEHLPINPFPHDQTSMAHADLTAEMASEPRDVPLPQLDEMVRSPRSKDDESVAGKPEPRLKNPTTGTAPSIAHSLDAPLQTHSQAERQKSEGLPGFHQKDEFHGEQLVMQALPLHQNQPLQPAMKTPLQPIPASSAIEDQSADVMESLSSSTSMRSQVLDAELALLKVERSPIIQRVVQQLVAESHPSAQPASLLPTSGIPRLALNHSEASVPSIQEGPRSHSKALTPPATQPLQPSHQRSTPAPKRIHPVVQPAIAVQPASQSNAAIASTESASAPPPTIQVTIGRIEVRATPPPSSPSKPASKAAVMGLSDYLRQRAQGAR